VHLLFSPPAVRAASLGRVARLRFLGEHVAIPASTGLVIRASLPRKARRHLVDPVVAFRFGRRQTTMALAACGRGKETLMKHSAKLAGPGDAQGQQAVQALVR
jgi:hypothetical protein